MRFAYTESMCDPLQYTALAQAAEECGFEAFLVPDSICYPEESDSKYPYTVDGGREFLDGKPFIDPFVQIAAMAAVTQKIKFLTFVLKTPIRHPVLLAKQTASLAVMSQNRFLLGMGLSPWPEDYAVCGERWEGRRERFDEMIQIMDGLLTGDYYGIDSEFYKIQRIKLCPVPDQKVPFYIGGHADSALQRAARFGDGWVHAGAGGRDDLEDLRKMVDRLLELRAEYGRDGEFRILAVTAHAYTDEGLKMLEDMGVTDVGIGFRDFYTQPDTQTLEQKIELMQGFAQQFIK